VDIHPTCTKTWSRRAVHDFSRSVPVAVGRTYTTKPAAALFLDFSVSNGSHSKISAASILIQIQMEDIYSEEKYAMIELAENAFDYCI
jgi:hypothetical protein